MSREPTEMEMRVALILDDVLSSLRPMGWGNIPPLEYEIAIWQSARAAIRAMREPTEGMVNSVCERGMYMGKVSVVKNAWLAMIDAASQPDPEK